MAIIVNPKPAGATPLGHSHMTAARLGFEPR